MTSREMRYWGNQHGHGVVMWGETAREFRIHAHLLGITHEALLERVVVEYALKVLAGAEA